MLFFSLTSNVADLINILFPEGILIKASVDIDTQVATEEIVVEAESDVILEQIRSKVPNRVAETSRLLEYLSKVKLIALILS